MKLHVDLSLLGYSCKAIDVSTKSVYEWIKQGELVRERNAKIHIKELLEFVDRVNYSQ